MSKSSVSTCALPPHLAWRSLKSRSIAAWDEIAPDETVHKRHGRELLETCTTLEDFLPQSARPGPMLWFFQLRNDFLSQNRMRKWSSCDMDGYVLLPVTEAYVTRKDCFFLSHFWHTKNDPDPNGDTLRLNQAQLGPQSWKFIWVDWTCAPQSPRSASEETYFERCLSSMPAIIRYCAFMYSYPPWEPRLWILYEIAEYRLTCTGYVEKTLDAETYIDHIDRMMEDGVLDTLKRHSYRCTNKRDYRYLVSWLDVLVILRRSNVDIYSLRSIMDCLTWQVSAGEQYHVGSAVSLNKYEGTLVIAGKLHSFHPFPR